MKKLKIMAKELDIPVIILSQLSRDVLKRNNKRPMKSDLKGSGAIEANADVIIMLNNPYDHDSNAVDEQGRSLEGQIEVIFEKNRMGATGIINVEWIKSNNRFSDLELTF